MPSPSPGLPDGETQLRAERQARARGSGLTAADLPGLWLFHQVWPRSGAAPQAAASSLLRALQGSLAIGTATGDTLPVHNRVQLGALELCFHGSGALSGRRPLLRFWFDRWQLRLGGRVLLERPLQRPQERALPFFALIARGQGERAADGSAAAWLAARGRGGGLALWQRDPAGAAGGKAMEASR